MAYILIPVIIGLVIMVVVSLIRGIVAFLQSTREDLERDPSAGPSPMQLKQNKMMFARIKYQAMAIVAIAFLAAVSHH
jgi:hypothetical protein